MARITLDKCWNTLYGIPLNQEDYWLKQFKIPIGTLQPYENYDLKEDGTRDIPLKEIVTIPYDPIDTPSTKRVAFNLLLLAGSGDGKSLILKQIWSILHRGGYRCGYIDPKSTDSGRARMKWDSPRLAPFLKAKGIGLQHFMPVWASKNIPHLAHNFRLYCTRLKRINEREMWQGLGMTDIASSYVTKIVNQYNYSNYDLSMRDLKHEVEHISKEMPEVTYNNIMRNLMILSDFEVISDNYHELNLLWEWQQGYSICISHAGASPSFMTFDIGQKIRESLDIQYKIKPNERIPIMWFMDDSSYYAKKHDLVKYNFAVKEIMNIGNNTRSLALYNCMAVQTLGIIDENVAETYRVKLISPLFSNPDSLSRINIPKSAISCIKNRELLVNRKHHLLEWLYIDENNEMTPFFPFTPPVNHFTEIYREKGEEGEIYE